MFTFGGALAPEKVKTAYRGQFNNLINIYGIGFGVVNVKNNLPVLIYKKDI